MSRSIEILSPSAPVRAGDHPLAPRPASLAGLRIGLLHNAKPNGDVLIERVEELLRAEDPAAEAVRWRKDNPAVPESRIEALVPRVDIVLNAIGD
ncbi:MAG: hypothetical protein V3V62_13495 [bacterium]